MKTPNARCGLRLQHSLYEHAAFMTLESSAKVLVAPSIAAIMELDEALLAGLDQDSGKLAEALAVLTVREDALAAKIRRHAPHLSYDNLLGLDLNGLNERKVRARSPASVIADLNYKGNDWRVHAASAAALAAAGVLMAAAEVAVLYNTLKSTYPDVAGEASPHRWLMSLIFVSMAVGAIFIAERFSAPVRATLDKLGLAAIALFVIGSGAMLLLVSAQLGAASAGDIGADLGGNITDIAQNTLSGVLSQLGAVAVGIALCGSSLVSLIGIHTCVTRGSASFKAFIESFSAKTEAKNLEAELEKLAALKAELAQRGQRIAERLASSASDLANLVASLYAQPLAVAQSWVIQNTLDPKAGEAAANPQHHELAAYDLAALQARIDTLQVQTDPMALRALIEAHRIPKSAL